MQTYRLGIDLGVNSLGWCALTLDRDGNPNGILDIGVRLFTDGRAPKTGTSLAADRRIARQMRRRRDRYLKRRTRLMTLLVRHGLMPADPDERKKLEALDPYELRARGLDERLEPFAFGRALFHLNQRRGFKSSRKTDKGDDKERGKIDAGARKLKEALVESGLRTLGEYLYKRHVAREAVRVRPIGKGAKAEYPFYPLRALVEDEFERLWSKQAEFHPDLLTADAKAAIKEAIFFQRPLRPVDPGRCTLDPTDERAPWALPLAQRFRMLQEINHLEIIGRDLKPRKLTLAQRDKIYAKLRTARTDPTFDQIRRLLGLDSDQRFNLENERRTALKGDAVGRALSDKSRFGKAWWTYSDSEQDEIVETILAADDEEELAAIARRDWRLDDDHARAVARVGLPHGYCRLGRKALSRIVDELVAGFVEVTDPATGEVYRAPLTYDQAVRRAGYHHADFRGDGAAPELDYYGKPLQRHMISATGAPDDPDEKRYGRFPNPTVHIGLNELRRVVNALIRQYGKPAEIAIELARDLKLSREERRRVEEKIKENTERNEALRKELVALGQKVNRENLQRLKLYHELPPQQRCCIYTGKPISVEMLFSDEVVIDHILPFKDTLDDSLANKVLCLRSANHDKGKRTPYDAFRHHPGYDWTGILLRTELLPKNKRWRFAEDALQRFADNADFIARHLTDTAYVARVAKEYLGQICPSDRVWAIPGKLTSLLRGKWGLNGILSDSNLKNRADHRHHAIDAFVVACTDRALLQRMSTAAGEARLDRTLEDLPDPWDGFDRDAFRDRIRSVVVSLKPDYGRQGRLHEATAYGLVADPAKEDGATVVYRKSFADLNENEIARIRDRDLRARVQAHVAAAAKGTKLSQAQLSQALAAFAANDEKYRGIRHVRLLKTEDPSTLIRLKDRQGRLYKALIPGENWCVDVYEQCKGKRAGKWIGVPVTMFEANQPQFAEERLNRLRRNGTLDAGARKIMRLHKGDYLRLEIDGEPRVMRIVRLEVENQRLRLAEHKESGNLEERHKDPDDPFRWTFVSFDQLRKRNARRVSVDLLGRVSDPGSPQLRRAAGA